MYDRLTVVELVSRNPVLWLCRCTCGNTVEVKSTNLGGDRAHNTRSCGCLQKEVSGGRFRLRPFEWLYKGHIVKRKQWDDLTYEEFLEFTSFKGCHYCGISLIWNQYRTGAGTQANTNLDRKDNSIGYTKSNLVPCCFRCNAIKSTHLTYNEMVEIGKCIRKMRE